MLAAMPMGLSAAAFAAGSLPGNGRYVSGAGSIQGAANSLTIDQSSKAGVINWQSFSIGQGNSVQFNNGTGATLNEVTSNNLSQIAGSLRSTGSVYVVNPAGVVVTPTGRVLTQGSFGAMTGNATGNIVNQGSIVSASGDVTLTGNDVTNTGAVVSMRGGHIWLNASGTASLGGTISASNVGGAGGSIVASGKTINVTGNLLATGATGGGSIAVGSWSAGAANVSNGATLNASAVQSGNGGHVSVISANTDFQGTASARGGASGGNGGLIETSGHYLDFGRGKVDASAPHGANGTWLLDPFDLTIDATAASTIDSTLNGGTDVLLQTTSSGCSGPGNCIAGSGDIDILAALGWSTSATLTLDAYHSINIGAPITLSGAGGLVLKTNDGGSGGDYFFNNGASAAFTDVIGGLTQGSLTINGTGFTLVNNVASLASDISANPTGDYALANSYNAAPDGTYAQSPVTTAFNGIFEGLGNTISNLTIKDSSTSDNVGLFSQAGSSATLRDIGLLNVSLAAKTSNGVGALVGDNSGSVAYSYAMGSVSSSNVGDLGGLIGYDNGSISQSYAAVAVSGGINNGGLVGYLSGSISQSYATGIVSGGTNNGGLVGDMSSGGTLSQSYATGVVFGGTYHGGLIGYDGSSAGSITSSYFDTETSGQSASEGAGNIANDPGITGTITLQLQSGLPSGFSAGAWAIVAGASFPYLQWQFTGTPQVISGTVLNGGGPYAGLTSQALANGVLLNGVAWSSGVNGYYSLLVPAGAITGQVLVYGMGVIGAATLEENASGSLSNINLFANYLYEPTGDSNYSTVVADLSTAIGGNSSVQSLINGLGLDIQASAANFTIDQSIDTSNLILSSTGSVTQSAAITATKLDLLGSGGSYLLTDSANSIGTLAGNTGTISLNDGANALTIGTVGGTSGVTATTLTLTDTGNVTQSGAITAGGLELLGSGGDYKLTDGANRIGILAGDTGTIDLNDGSRALAIGTAGSTSGVTAASLTLTDTGNVTQSQAITATNLDLLGAGGNYVLTDGTNSIDMLAGNTGIVNLTDGTGLTVGWAANNLAVTGPLTLTTVGSGNNLSIAYKLSTRGIATLVSAGTLGETGAGTIDAATLTGSSAGGVVLNGANLIGTLASFTNAGAGGFALIDREGLTVTGPLDQGSGDIALTTDGGGITLNAALSADMIMLSSTGLVTQSAGITATRLDLLGTGGNYQLTDNANSIGVLAGDTGTINLDDGGNALAIGTVAGTRGVTARTLTLTDTGNVTQGQAIDVGQLDLLGSGGGYTLTNSANRIGTLAANTGTVAVTDASALTIGTVGGTTGLTASGPVALKTLDLARINIDAALTATSVDFTSAGTIGQSGTGIITAGILTGSSAAGTVLDAANAITDLGPFTVGMGGFSFTDAAALTVNGAVTVNSGTLTLKTTGAGDNLVIDAALTDTGTIDLMSAATIDGNGSGIITAGTLQGSSKGDVTLTADNVIGDLGSFSTGNGAFSLTDAGSLTIAGAVDAGTGAVSLTTLNSGNIVIDGAITGTSLVLTSAGTISQNGSGIITAGTLTGSSAGATTLTAANAIAHLGTFSTSAGAFLLADAGTLTVDGAITVNGGALTLKTTGTKHNLVVHAALTDSGTIDLVSAGTIGSNGAGIITAGTLKGSSKGAVTLAADNMIQDLGSFTTGNGAFSLTDAESLTVAGGINAGTGVLSLTTLNLGNITINANLTGATIDLTSAGDMTESSTAAIITTLLNVTASTGITLTSSHNRIGSVGTDTTNSGPNNITL